MASSYVRQLQDIVERYRASGKPWPASAKTITVWAMQNNLLQIRQSDAINRLSNDVARAMREEYYTDSQGRRVRAKHCANLPIDGEQMPLWDDHRTAEREFMVIALQQRRQGVVGDCKQLKTDADSYTENKCPNDPIKLVFDFTYDLEENP
jgi:hypothetical protein